MNKVRDLQHDALCVCVCVYAIAMCVLNYHTALTQHCREQFVVLHKQPILQDLAAFWEAKFGGLK